MQEVRLDLSNYDALQNSIRSKNARIDALEQEIEKIKKDHEEEISLMASEGKVRVVTRTRPMVVPFLFGLCSGCDETKVKYEGFDDVKSEVYEHFKNGLFDDELEKLKKEQIDSVFKSLTDKEQEVSDLKDDISRLKGRSLWERIRNK